MKQSRIHIYYIALICLLLTVASCRDNSATAGQPSVSIMFTGDVLLDRGVREVLKRHPADCLWSDFAPLFQECDATVINLECPVTDTLSPINKQYIFRGDPAVLRAMKDAGVTHAAMANNHTMDQDRRGLTATAGNLVAAGIVPIGYGRSQHEAIRPVYVEKDGIRVAIFNTVTLPLENYTYLDSRPDVCRASVSQLAEAIKDAKRVDGDLRIVAVLHWGAEHQLTPTRSQRMDARLLVNAGADAVIGHHPHVLQPVDTIRGCPVFYSLGNFIFDQRHPDNCHTATVRLTFTADTVVCRVYHGEIINCIPRLRH